MNHPRFELLGFNGAAPKYRDHHDLNFKNIRSMTIAFVTVETIRKIGSELADLKLELIMLRKETSNEKNSNKENACKH